MFPYFLAELLIDLIGFLQFSLGNCSLGHLCYWVSIELLSISCKVHAENHPPAPLSVILEGLSLQLNHCFVVRSCVFFMSVFHVMAWTTLNQIEFTLVLQDLNCLIGRYLTPLQKETFLTQDDVCKI